MKVPSQRPFFPWFRNAAAAALLPVLLAGCDLNDVIRWAPDGQHALVQTANGGSYIVDGNGTVVADGHGMQLWMPDSHRTLEVHAVAARDWAEYAGVLGPERAAEVAKAAEALLPGVKSDTGAWDKFGDDPAVKQWVAAHPAVSLESAIYYLAKQRTKAIAGALNRWSKEGHGPEPASISIYELILQEALPKGKPSVQTLLRSADAVPFVLPSPKGTAIVFVRSRDDVDRLEIISTEGGKPRTVAEGVEQADWTSDGQQLVFSKPAVAQKTKQVENLPLGTIMRQRVCAADGGILQEFAAGEELATTVFFTGRSRVAALPDGQILFSMMDVHFPMLSSDPPPDCILYTVRTGDNPKADAGPANGDVPAKDKVFVLKRVVSAEAQKKLPDRADCFVLSPDGRRAAIPGENGIVAVVSLENGEVTTLQDKGWDFGSQAKFLNTVRLSTVTPSWRSADELCYVAPMPDRDGQPQRAEMVLHKLGGEPRPISQRWSDAATDAFLPRLKPTEAK